MLEGEARLANGSLDFYLTNLRLRELQATVRLQDTSLTLDAAGQGGRRDARRSTVDSAGASARLTASSR